MGRSGSRNSHPPPTSSVRRRMAVGSRRDRASARGVRDRCLAGRIGRGRGPRCGQRFGRRSCDVKPRSVPGLPGRRGAGSASAVVSATVPAAGADVDPGVAAPEDRPSPAPDPVRRERTERQPGCRATGPLSPSSRSKAMPPTRLVVGVKSHPRHGASPKRRPPGPRSARKPEEWRSRQAEGSDRDSPRRYPGPQARVAARRRSWVRPAPGSAQPRGRLGWRDRVRRSRYGSRLLHLLARGDGRCLTGRGQVAERGQAMASISTAPRGPDRPRAGLPPRRFDDPDEVESCIAVGIRPNFRWVAWPRDRDRARRRAARARNPGSPAGSVRRLRRRRPGDEPGGRHWCRCRLGDRPGPGAAMVRAPAWRSVREFRRVPVRPCDPRSPPRPRRWPDHSAPVEGLRPSRPAPGSPPPRERPGRTGMRNRGQHGDVRRRESGDLGDGRGLHVDGGRGVTGRFGMSRRRRTLLDRRLRARQADRLARAIIVVRRQIRTGGLSPCSSRHRGRSSLLRNRGLRAGGGESVAMPRLLAQRVGGSHIGRGSQAILGA